MINLHCPDFYTGVNIYVKLVELYRRGPEAFREDVNLTHIFGSIPGMTWNGGSVIQGGVTDIRQLVEIAGIYEAFNIPLKLTLTNPMLEEQDIYDRYCNSIVKIFENEYNEILVSSPILEEYLREKYPHYKFDKSIIQNTITQDQDTIEDYIKILEQHKYETIVIPRTKAKDMEFLNKIPKEYRKNIEILLNDVCPLYCPKIGIHYTQIGKAQLYDLSYMECANQCVSKSLYPAYTNSDAMISYNEIKTIYEPLGYSEFKISGRWSKISIILNIVPYLIKPEYQKDVYQHLFMAAFTQDEASKI